MSREAGADRGKGDGRQDTTDTHDATSAAAPNA